MTAPVALAPAAAYPVPSGRCPIIVAGSTHREQEDVLPTIDQQGHVEAEPALVHVASDVSAAKADIRALLRGDAARTWTIREVQDSIHAWSGTIVSLALMDMERHGEVETGADLGVRVLALQAN